MVLPYNREWEAAFEEIKKEIESAIGDCIVGIEHVGSTSVEGLSAKPCIDIDAIIKDYSVFKAVVAKHEPRGIDAVGHIKRFDFYEEAKDSYCILQTGETAVYACVIIQKGVVRTQK